MSSIIFNFPNLPPALQQQILDGPALAPPDGVTPVFKNPPNRNGQAIAVLVVCLFLSTMAAIGRAYSRTFVMKRVQLQDYLGLLAFGSYAVLAWVYLDFLHNAGFFVHQWNIQLKDMVHIAPGLTFGLTISYSASLLFAKSAILLEWVRIFSPHRTNRVFYWCSYLMIVLNILLYISSIISSAITCIPHQSIYYPWIPGVCINRKALGLFTAFFNVIMDLLILLLPQRIIWTLQMTTSRKAGISLIFSVGVLATVCAIGRLVTTFLIDYDADATYTVAPVILWTFPEVTCVLLVFCLPSLPKSFADQGPIFEGVQMMRSWISLSTQRSQKSSIRSKNQSGWSSTARKQRNAHVYGMTDEYGPVTSQAELKLVRANSRKGNEATQDQLPPLPGQAQ
ncbi:uncharacterized protein GGS22DRAFT_41758 [Annulohypoxylon maeteangense]|uniref:uncharacterized protein n=1 Tax=Annulohypoxylon maeteangense TaxID=1927788 RepID=UPI002008C62A|nr:uncharacterized protein GGS22DRAFT_41758 [Annulohypoxylon maeteangense]KAI0882849.1 hypothetical protein GGS22DRAFT_41758 [Annulohypoxylon maeteangense]